MPGAALAAADQSSHHNVVHVSAQTGPRRFWSGSDDGPANMSEAFWVFLWWLLGLYFVGLVAASVAHECGHLLSARLCSIPVGQFGIGSGPVVLRWRVGGTQVVLRLVPVGGLVMPAVLPDLQKRWPMALFFIGGVLGNIAAIGAMIALHAAGAAPVVLYDGAGMPLIVAQAGILVGTQLFIIILSLIPHRASLDGRPMASDGLQLLRLFSGGFRYAASLEPYRSSATRLAMTSPASSRIAYQLARTDRWTSEDARCDFRAALRRELAEGSLPPEEEMLVLDALVTDGLTFADPAVRPELGQWSQRALQLGPKVRTLIGSRGAVLVELGRYDEGRQLLETVAFSSDVAPFDALMSQIFLARAEHALGNADLACDLMTKVRSVINNPGAFGPAVMALIERIDNEMQSQR